MFAWHQLFWAAEKGRADEVLELLREGADIEFRDEVCFHCRIFVMQCITLELMVSVCLYLRVCLRALLPCR